MNRLPVQPWMNDANVSRLFTALGVPDVDVRFVGGSVRDAVMGRAVGERDIATPEIPDRVVERLKVAGIKAVPTGVDHGTITAVVDGMPFEVTTLRRDTATDGRHAVVAFTTDWREDAMRRDFTVNAMSLRPTGELFDFHGGAEDAKAGRMRFVGNPGDRMQEDYLRILRLFRFHAQFGRVPIDAETLAACRAHGAGLAQLSAERIHQEISKLLSAPNPVPAIRMMADCGVLARVLPEAESWAVLENLIKREHEAADFPADWLRRLAALVPNQKPALAAAERLKCSNAEYVRLAALTDSAPVGRDTLSVNRALYRLGPRLFADRVLLVWAREGGEGWSALLDKARHWTPKVPPVSGADVLSLGIAPGPRVGRLLSAVEEWWIGEGFSPDRTQALAQLQSLAQKE